MSNFNFNPINLALVRKLTPELFANKVVGVQPMSTPVGLAYAMKFNYNTKIKFNFRNKEFYIDLNNKHLARFIVKRYIKGNKTYALLNINNTDHGISELSKHLISNIK